MLKQLYIIIISLFLAGCNSDSQEKQLPERPNIVFIICDDLNDIAVNNQGHPQAKLPNIQSLAGKGVSFVNAINNAPLCAPSRASMLAGIYPHTSRYFGFRHNIRYYRASPVLEEAKTFVEHFMENGYEVFGTGKLYHNGAREWPNDNFGYAQSFSPFPWDGKYNTKRSPDSLGFLPHPNQHEALQSHWEATFGRLSEIPVFPDSEDAEYQGWVSYSKPYKYVSSEERDLMPDEKYAQYAVDVINGEHSKPFLLAVGFTSTHTPYYAPDNYFDRFPLEDLERATFLTDDLEDCADILAEEEGTSNTDYGFRRYNNVMAAGGENLLLKWTQAYLACAALVDDQIGKIVNAIQKSPHADNTIIIVTSDHGFHMGEKEFLFKNSVWHESLNIPLIFAGPGIANGDVEQPVSLIDVYPTLIDLCNLPENPNTETNQVPLDGFSLVPFLKNPGFTDWDGPDVSLSVIQGTEITDMNDPSSVKKQHYVVHGSDYNYVYCNNGEEELYHTSEDPYEWFNLANDTVYVNEKQRMKNALFELVPGLK